MTKKYWICYASFKILNYSASCQLFNQPWTYLANGGEHMASEDHRLQTGERESILYLLPNRKNEREKNERKVLSLNFSLAVTHT